MSLPKRVLIDDYFPWESFQEIVDYGFFLMNDLVPFESDTKNFDIKKAWWFSEFCRLIYIDDVDLVNKILKDAKLDYQYMFLSDIGSQSGIFYNDKRIILVFRGTEFEEKDGSKGLDLLTNFDFCLTTSLTKGKVHRGFKKAVDCVWDEISTALSKIRTPEHELWIAGHSLGAGLATVAASRIENPNGLYTFGAPRVGSIKFVRYLRRHVPWFRINHCRDIVPRVPPPLLYTHGGKNVFITLDGKIILNPSYLSRAKLRIGDKESRIFYTFIKIAISKAFLLDLAKEGYLNHIHYNYAVHMWNNI